jgi:phosphatidylcholine synthase
VCNLVAFYLYVLTPEPWLAAAVIVALAILTFVPVLFVHPLRVRHWRVLNIALMVVWAALALITVIADLAPGPVVRIALCVIALYFLVAGLLRKAA